MILWKYFLYWWICFFVGWIVNLINFIWLNGGFFFVGIFNINFYVFVISVLNCVFFLMLYGVGLNKIICILFLVIYFIYFFVINESFN